jgi:hypothetical protein
MRSHLHRVASTAAALGFAVIGYQNPKVGWPFLLIAVCVWFVTHDRVFPHIERFWKHSESNSSLISAFRFVSIKKMIGWLIFASCFLFAGWGVKYEMSPHLTLAFASPILGSNVVENPHPMTSFFALVSLKNSGTPSITDDWKMTAIIDDGEVLTALPSPKGYAAGIISYELPDSIYNKTARIPLARGSSEIGYVDFLFVGVRREALLRPGTKFTIHFRDVTGKEYSLIHVWTAQELLQNNPI